MKWFCSDHHFNHRGILKHDALDNVMESYDPNAWGWREFKNVQEMNGVMVYNWNQVVKPGDLVYHLGDLALPNKGDGNDVGELLDMLNGQIILILGNHDDKNIDLFKDHNKIVKMSHLEYIKLDSGQKVMLCHYPMLTWRASVHGSWQLHGHSHGTLPEMSGKRLDVGVDCHNYTPINEAQITELMAKKPENLDAGNKRVDTEKGMELTEAT